MRTATQILMVAAAAAAWAGQKQAEESTPFQGHGVIVDINSFFIATGAGPRRSCRRSTRSPAAPW